MVHNVKLGKNMRSVSIVGIGATPFLMAYRMKHTKDLRTGNSLDMLHWMQ